MPLIENTDYTVSSSSRSGGRTIEVLTPDPADPWRFYRQGSTTSP